MTSYDKIDESNIDEIFAGRGGKVFAQVLEDAGVYKRTESGERIPSFYRNIII